MIVKNEERVLRRSIDSVRPIVDEYVIVDTGSTDATRRIVAEYGEVHSLPFTDFAETKNRALRLARGDAILFMDADEYVIKGLERLRRYAERGTEAVSARIVEGPGTEVWATYYRVRLFRNHHDWHFEGPGGVHETLVGPGPITLDPVIRVRHGHTHRTAENYLARAQMYRRALLDSLQRDPDDRRALYFLARTYLSLGRHSRAIRTFRRFLRLDGLSTQERWDATYGTAVLRLRQGERRRCGEACKAAIAIDPRRAEAWTLLGALHFDRGRWNAARCCFEEARRLPLPKDVVLVVDPRAYGETPERLLALCRERMRVAKRAPAPRLRRGGAR